MKPGKNFRLSKTTKRMMSLMKNKSLRNSFKRMMIDAQLCGAVVFKKEKSDKK
jgi:hypothetical protein